MLNIVPVMSRELSGRVRRPPGLPAAYPWRVGAVAYECYMGDSGTQPNPNLGPVGQPPYYAIPVLPGTIGTKGGPITDTHRRVLREDGQPIRGL
ncbi:MAG: FAD-binding protein [Streptosporangiaceae bacterium]|nr:FAD-binding protein [Streptosporangiaceae bacterium]